MAYWLLKTEPNEFSIDDLAQCQVEPWTGVRNYQARNFLRDDIAVGDRVFIYHSSCKPSGIAGTATISRAAYPDPSQYDPSSPGFDAKSSQEAPRWYCVDVAFVQRYPRVISLHELKAVTALQEMVLLQRARLSVQPVTAAQWACIENLAKSLA